MRDLREFLGLGFFLQFEEACIGALELVLNPCLASANHARNLLFRVDVFVLL